MRLLLSFLLACCGVCHAQITFIGKDALMGKVGVVGSYGASGVNWAQDKAGVTNGASGTSIATSFSPSSGALTVVWILYRNDVSQTVTSVTDNSGSTYSAAFNIANVNTHYTIAVFYCANTLSGVTSVTVNVPTSGRINVVMKSYTGQAASPLGQVATMSGTGTTSASQTSPNLTTTHPNDLLVGYVFQNTDYTSYFSATSPWSLVAVEPDPSDGAVLGAEDNLNRPTGTYNAAFTTLISVTWWCSIASFHQ